MSWQTLILIPVVTASLFWLMTTLCAAIFMNKKRIASTAHTSNSFAPTVSLIKPVHGLEKDLFVNLATACKQDYPDYEIIYAVQKKDDPAIKILENINETFRHKNISIVIDENRAGSNGKVNNIYNASLRAKGEVLVFSDSDMFLKSDYLRKIVAPLADKQVGICCTLYQAWKPENLFEALELLSYNADFIPSIIFAVVTKTSIACPGATFALRREILEEIGGLASLGDYFVEDYEIGKRAVEKGYDIHFISYVAQMSVDLKKFRDWWVHQVCWDQKTKTANPFGFFFSLSIRGIPFACLYAFLGASYGWPVLLGTIGLRLVTAISNAFILKDRDGLKTVWLLPLRDFLGIFVLIASFLKRNTYWKEKTFVLKKGKLVEIK
jgi:ceramide glucosyltransferase